MSSQHPYPHQHHLLAIGTRLHLGNASAPPEAEYFRDLLEKFSAFASSCDASHAYVAVDSTPRFQNYCLEDVIRTLASAINSDSLRLQIIPVTPWNAFVPALNAIASRSALDGASLCLFCSAETQTSPESVRILLQHMDDDDVLVAGAVLPGHSYQKNSIQPLNGVTTPWNTLAVWNLAKLTLVGFPLVADGLHTIVIDNDDESNNNNSNQQGIRTKRAPGGVEEVSAIALLQHLLGPTHAKAKLVPLLPDDTLWDQDFNGNKERQAWHETKMKSKVERPAVHLQLLNLHDGVVEHC
ncbi:hypothetical protein MHU86_3972 [Fragilaria crotonensis]|nr:hypothetical protein MHU86_3972 [Fragilaria crotonensis]